MYLPRKAVQNCEMRWQLFSLHLKCSYLVPYNAAARPSYTIGTELFTAYYTIFQVSLLSYKYLYIYIYIFLLTFLITHKVVHLLEFLVSNGKAAKVQITCSNILDFCLSCCQADTVSGIGQLLLKDSKLLYDIRQKRFKQASA